MTPHRFGDFDSRTVVGAFEPILDDMRPDVGYYGLSLILEYLYGFLRTENGSIVALEQKFSGALNSGTYVMTNQGDKSDLEVHPITLRTQRGEVRRTVDEDRRVWSRPVMYGLPDAVQREGDLPYHLELSGRDLLYDQGELCHLEGANNCLGVQLFSVSRQEPLLYCSMPYWVSGTVLGEPAEGFLFLDRCHTIPGREWKETAMFADLQVSWQVFANRFEDGTTEFGHIINGKTGFNVQAVVEGDDVLAAASRTDSRFWMDEDRFVDKGMFASSDGEWTFAGHDEGKMLAFSESRWNGYRAQFGSTRRLGDDRVPVESISWIEHFPARIEEEGLVA